MSEPVMVDGIELLNGTDVPCIGGPADGAHIPYKGTPHGIRVERPPTILTVNPAPVFEQATYHACFFRAGDKAFAFYRHSEIADDEALKTVFKKYGLFDTRKPRGPNTGGEGKGLH